MAQFKRPHRLIKPPPLTIPESPRTPTPTLEEHSAELQIGSQKDLVSLSPLGRGNFAIVDKCLHRPSQTIVACKRVILTSDEEYQRRVIKEVALMSRCHCRNIVRSYVAFVQDASIYIVMELMDKGSLKEALQIYGRMSEAVIGHLAYQVLKGLDYLHSQINIVHRDIKPSNLLINSQGAVKISDLGICCESTNRSFSYIGTASYMSVRYTQPERLDTQPYNSDTDIWSLGVTLLECALGRFPYSSAGEPALNFWSLNERICREPMPQVPGSSVEFKDFLKICLGKESGTRSSCRALLSHDFIQRNTDNTDFLDWVARLPNK